MILGHLMYPSYEVHRVVYTHLALPVKEIAEMDRFGLALL